MNKSFIKAGLSVVTALFVGQASLAAVTSALPEAQVQELSPQEQMIHPRFLS